MLNDLNKKSKKIGFRIEKKAKIIFVFKKKEETP